MGKELPCFPEVVQRFLITRGRVNDLCFFVAAFFSLFFSYLQIQFSWALLTISYKTVSSEDSVYSRGCSHPSVGMYTRVCICEGVNAIFCSIKSVLQWIHLKNWLKMQGSQENQWRNNKSTVLSVRIMRSVLWNTVSCLIREYDRNQSQNCGTGCVWAYCIYQLCRTSGVTQKIQ